MDCPKFITLLIFSSMFGISTSVMAQENYHTRVSTNFGMSARHSEDELPYSRTPVEFPERVAKITAGTRLLQDADGSWSIVGGWEMADADQLVLSEKSIFSKDFDTSSWYNATVPGTVLTTLVNQGVYPDPYYGANNMAIPESLCRKDWWYRIELPLSGELLAKPQLELLFNGINYRADIWFNGVKLGTINGAFIRGRFDITEIASSENVLAVHIFPPNNPGIPHEQSSKTGRGPNGGVLCLDGPTFISSEGWDWMPGVRDRNIGIWQDVKLIASEGVTIHDTRVVTDLPLPATDHADITISTSLKNVSKVDRHVELRANIDGMTISKTVDVPAASEVEAVLSPEEFPQLKFHQPRLWMPNGYGEQNLYNLALECSFDGKVSDRAEVCFGVREYTYELTVDTPSEQGVRINYSPTDILGHGNVFNNRLLRPVGNEVVVPSVREGVDVASLGRVEEDEMAPYLVIRCNGVRMFCKGGNWGMDDMMKCCTREHLEPYFKLHKEAGFNMIRNWTGESTEEMFYALCDEYGMMVWNDFWMSTEGYNLNPADEDLFMENALDAVKRFRNHPSIAVWCPRNEGFAAESIESRLSGMLAETDGTRHYSPNSRYSNLRTSGPWHYFTDASLYYTERAFGFNTELGSPSVPTARTMRKFMSEADQWPISEVWHYHDLHPETRTYVSKVSEMYGTATGLDDFCRKVQIMNYDSYRAMFESWNSKLWNNTSGVLLWMTHPAWPSVEWQSYSYDYETFGSWFGSKKACESVHVQMNLHDHKIVVLNNTLSDLTSLKVDLTVTDLQGRKLLSKTEMLDKALANALTPVFKAELPATDKVVIVRLRLLSKNRIVLSRNDYVMDMSGARNFQSLNDLPAVSLKAKQGKKWVEGSDTVQEWTITNPSSTIAMFIKLDLEDLETEEQVLPAIFSDGYFHLYPGESRALTVKYQCSHKVGLSAEGYNVNPTIQMK